MARSERRRGIASPVPPAFLARMADLLGEEFGAFVAASALPPVAGLRANTLKVDPVQLASELPFELAPVAWSAAGFALNGSAEAGKHPYHAAGLYYLQDPSAMAVAELLDPQPGERVLDLSAAPGGKATDIVARMGGRGVLVVNEVIHKRAWDLAQNLERWGARNAIILNETTQRLAARLGAAFDRVLVDAPCSGEGMFRKSEAARAEWSPALVAGCAQRQDGVLDDAAPLVRPGGRLVYSTCTFAPEENEGSVARFLDRHPEYELVDAAPLPGFDAGRPAWAPGANHLLARTVRLWPHRIQGEGHFIAVFRRSGEAAGAANAYGARARGSAGFVSPAAALGRAALQALRAFWEATLVAPLPERLVLEGTYLYALPAAAPDLAGLRAIHLGWWLGTLKGDRLEPAHALALGLSAGDARRTHELPLEGREVLAFLRGESLDAPGEDGWTLVTTGGHPLGWAKRVQGRLKSHYPKGLRWT